MKKMILVSFSVRTKKFKSRYEISKFFRMLYGWKQIVSSPSKRYEYERDGVLSSIPYVKIDQSSFFVPEDFAEEIINFFEEWSDKVLFKTFKVLVEEDEEWLKM